MTRHPFLVAVACLALSACNRSVPAPDSGSPGVVPTAAAPEVSKPEGAAGEYVISVPIQYENLTIFPIVSKSPRLEDRFMTLDEGLKAGTVEIREIGASVEARQVGQNTAQGGASRTVPGPVNEEIAAEGDPDTSDQGLDAGNDVNRLTVVNRGGKPLYLMPGEIIVGGSQDRTIAEELVIAATGEPVVIDVYCVEHGRWGARDTDTIAAVLNEVDADLSSDKDVAAQANGGKFVAKGGNLSKSSRFAVQAAEGQQKVWEEVEKTNDVSGASWSSGAFTANYVDPEVVERLKPYVDALSRRVSDEERVVGIVVAINGKIETVDVFESTPLFRKLWPQLLKSFALDALDVHDAEDAGKLSTTREAEAFLASVFQDQRGESRKTDGGLVVSRHETKDAVGFMGGMGMGMGGFGGAIHASGYSK